MVHHAHKGGVIHDHTLPDREGSPHHVRDRTLVWSRFHSSPQYGLDVDLGLLQSRGEPVHGMAQINWAILLETWGCGQATPVTCRTRGAVIGRVAARVLDGRGRVPPTLLTSPLFRNYSSINVATTTSAIGISRTLFGRGGISLQTGR